LAAERRRSNGVARRYVPKTYNNRRLLRIVFGTVVSAALTAVILFLLLFFVLENYYVDGRLDIPWLLEEQITAD